MTDPSPESERGSAVLSRVRQAAAEEGFTLCGVTAAIPSPGFDDLVRWIELGYAAGMDFFERRREAYRHPDRVLAGVKSIVVLAAPYPAAGSPGIGSGQGRVARYAWNGDDYHDVIHAKLKRICTAVERLPGPGFGAAKLNAGGDAERPIRARGVVDTAPLMEREIAQLAGLGWRGKNTLLLHPTLGSYFFLACLLVDVELPIDRPFETFHCGSCRACLDACPTTAFPQPGVLDASRCISYLTIEHRGPIPVEHRAAIGEWVFGCDVCQEVCPWNRKPTRKEVEREWPLETLRLRELFSLSDDVFRDRFRNTPLWRARRRGLLRNAAIVLGNQRDLLAEPALVAALEDEDPVVRGAVAWGLGCLATPSARGALRDRSDVECDPVVRAELELAMQPDRALTNQGSSGLSVNEPT